MLVKVPDSCPDFMRGRHRLANPSLRPLGQPGAGGSQEQPEAAMEEPGATFWASAWPLAWPGPQDGLGQGGLRLKWAKGRSGSKIDEKVKVLRMEFSIVENLSGLQESIFNLSRGPQLHFGEKSKNWSNFIKFTDFPPFPLFGVPWAAVICVVRPLSF